MHVNSPPSKILNVQLKIQKLSKIKTMSLILWKRIKIGIKQPRLKLIYRIRRRLLRKLQNWKKGSKSCFEPKLVIRINLRTNKKKRKSAWLHNSYLLELLKRVIVRKMSWNDAHHLPRKSVMLMIPRSLVIRSVVHNDPNRLWFLETNRKGW
jgi:hypothetical protein